MQFRKKVFNALLLSSIILIQLSAEAQNKTPVPPATVRVERPNEVADAVKIPWLSTYYIQPTLSEKDDMKIRFYVTDYEQSELRKGDRSHRFTVRLEIWPKGRHNDADLKKILEAKDIPAGDNEINAGKFAPGMYSLTLTAVDKQDRHAAVFYHEIWVQTPEEAKISDKQTFTVTDADLKQFNINKNGEYGEIRFIDATGKDEKTTKELTQAAAKGVKVPSGKYIVFVGGEKFNEADFSPDAASAKRGSQGTYKPEWLPNVYSWRSCTVVYATDYDKKKVEAEACTNVKGINELLKKAAADGYRKVILPKGFYRISFTEPISVPTKMTLDLNGSVIKVNPFTGDKNFAIEIKNCFDSHVINGIVEGDYFEHDYAASHSEWCCGVEITANSRFCSFENLMIRYITGYGASNGLGNGFKHRAANPFKNFEYASINRQTGEVEKEVPGWVVSEMVDISKFRQQSEFLTVSRYLGYQGSSEDDMAMQYHFYDADKKYLCTIDGRQYRRVLIPDSAKFLRVTVCDLELPDEINLRVNYFDNPWNCSMKDLFILSARAVGMAPSGMYNHKIQNCTFVRSGENLARCAFDAEDGWDMMQDVWIVGNKFYKNPYNDIITCAGHNFVIENNEGGIGLWDRTNSYVIRNNVICRSSNFKYTTRGRTGLPRIDGNTFRGKMHLAIGSPARKKPVKNVSGDAAIAAGDAATEAAQQAKTVERKTYPSNWLFLYNASDIPENVSISCGETARLLNSKLTLKQPHPTPAPSMLGGSLADSDIDTPQSMEGVTIRNTKILIAGKDSKFKDCTLENVDFQYTCTATLDATNCTFKNCRFNMGYWSKPVTGHFTNCKIECTERALGWIPAYAVGILEFRNCEFKSATKPIIEISDLRAQPTDNLVGKYLFTDCKFNVAAPYLFSVGGKESKKTLVFDFTGAKMTGSKKPLIFQREIKGWRVENLKEK